MGTFWFAYLLAYKLGADQYSALGGNAPTTKGVEVRILESLGPQGASKAECEKYADSMRPVFASKFKLPDHRLIKYQCVELTLPK